MKFNKRAEISNAKANAIRIASVFTALVVASLLLFTMDQNPVVVYTSMLEGAFGTAYRIRETIIKAIPLAITALGISVAFKMKFWNIGAEGQIAMGAFAAAFVALKMPGLPQPIMLTMMFIAATIAGGLWGAIPAFFKAQLGTNESITTLMMNYIALKWLTYLQYGPWKDPNAMGFAKIANFGKEAWLPKVFGVHMGWIIVLVLAFLVYIFMKKSKYGYEIAVLGHSHNTAEYSGINIKKTIIISMFISGGLCGIAGMVEASAVHNTLSATITGGVGYTAIIIAWLSGLSAPVIVVTSFLFAILVQGGLFIQSALGIPSAAASILQGIILFFVLGSEFFVGYTVDFKKEGK